MSNGAVPKELTGPVQTCQVQAPIVEVQALLAPLNPLQGARSDGHFSGKLQQRHQLCSVRSKRPQQGLTCSCEPCCMSPMHIIRATAAPIWLNMHVGEHLFLQGELRRRVCGSLRSCLRVQQAVSLLSSEIKHPRLHARGWRAAYAGPAAKHCKALYGLLGFLAPAGNDKVELETQALLSRSCLQNQSSYG